MGNIWISILLIILGAIVGKVADLTIEFIKRISPRIEYSTVEGIPIESEDKKYLCAYDLKISNASSKKVEDITFHLRAGDSLKLKGIEKPTGLECNSVEKEGTIVLSIPYLKRGDNVKIRAIAESKYVSPGSLRVAFSSPNDIIATQTQNTESRSLSGLTIPFMIAGCFAGLVVLVGSWVLAPQHEAMIPKFEPDRRDIVISVASTVGLPRIAELWLSAPDPKYYNVGDIAYSFAVASNKPDEIDKYRKLISLTLGADSSIAPESQADMFYSLGKLDLLLSDDKSAVSDFQNAVKKSRTTVEAHAKADAKTKKYLTDHGLL